MNIYDEKLRELLGRIAKYYNEDRFTAIFEKSRAEIVSALLLQFHFQQGRKEMAVELCNTQRDFDIIAQREIFLCDIFRYVVLAADAESTEIGYQYIDLAHRIFDKLDKLKTR